MARASKKTAAEPTITAFKGFDANLQCRGYAFEIGKTYTHDGKVAACSSGFHACENPLDVWSYYDLNGSNRFCRVQLSGKTDRHEGDSKIAAERIYIETEVTLGEMIREGVRQDIEAATQRADNASSGNYARNASSGYGATNASSGNGATNASSGNYARNASSGHYATNASSGDGARNASSGYGARNASSGHYATNASSGNGARNASSGNSATNASSGNGARNASSGDYAGNEATGANSVIAAAGLYSTAKGAKGTAIALPYKDKSGQIRFACGVAGEDDVPADTWLQAKDGKLVAA